MRWTGLQKGVLAVTVVNTAWAIAGLVANPSFATGDAATSVRVLGIDFNGWHAASGLLVFVPGFYFVRKGGLPLRAYVAAMIPSLVGPGIWALFDNRPMGLWPFEHPTSDAILHFANAAVYAALLVWGWSSDRSAVTLSPGL